MGPQIKGKFSLKNTRDAGQLTHASESLTPGKICEGKTTGSPKADGATN